MNRTQNHCFDVRCGLPSDHQGRCVEDPDDHDYEVVVGNIGTVYTGNSPITAMATFETYKKQSISGIGRAGGEPVTLMKDGEPDQEFLGADEVSEEEEDTPRHPGCNQCQMLNINGVNCHEHGCPNRGATWSQERGQWVRYFECGECGDQIEVGERCNCGDPVEEEESTVCAANGCTNLVTGDAELCHEHAETNCSTCGESHEECNCGE